METRARYALIGFFILAVFGAAFGFVYWLENKGGFGEREDYRIQFESAVPGLYIGSAVLFNGIRVGDVTSVSLNPAQPQQVLVDPGQPARGLGTFGLEAADSGRLFEDGAALLW